MDGIFGPETQAALRYFQKENGMNATGEPSGQTLAAPGINQGQAQENANAGKAPQGQRSASAKKPAQPQNEQNGSAQPQNQPEPQGGGQPENQPEQGTSK